MGPELPTTFSLLTNYPSGIVCLCLAESYLKHFWNLKMLVCIQQGSMHDFPIKYIEDIFFKIILDIKVLFVPQM